MDTDGDMSFLHGCELHCACRPKHVFPVLSKSFRHREQRVSARQGLRGTLPGPGDQRMAARINFSRASRPPRRSGPPPHPPTTTLGSR